MAEADEIVKANLDELSSGRSGQRLLGYVGWTDEQALYVVENPGDSWDAGSNTFTAEGGYEAQNNALRYFNLDMDTVIYMVEEPGDAVQAFSDSSLGDLQSGKTRDRYGEYYLGVGEGVVQLYDDTDAMVEDGVDYVYLVHVQEDFDGEQAWDDSEAKSTLVQGLRDAEGSGANGGEVVILLASGMAESGQQFALDLSQDRRAAGQFVGNTAGGEILAASRASIRARPETFKLLNSKVTRNNGRLCLEPPTITDDLVSVVDGPRSGTHGVRLDRDGVTLTVVDVDDAVAGQVRRARHELVKQGGMTAKSYEGFQAVANEFGVVIEVRPMSLRSRELVEQGLAKAKPEWIKNKTISAIDVEWLGAPSQHTGKVGHFRPKKPTRPPGMSDKQWAGIQKRYAQRLAEFETPHGPLKRAIDRGSVQIREGIVVDWKSNKPFAGDYDLFAYYEADGITPLAADRAARVDQALQDLGLTEHGAAMMWDTEGVKAYEAMKQGMIDNHTLNEPLVRIGADDAMPELTLHEPGLEHPTLPPQHAEVPPGPNSSGAWLAVGAVDALLAEEGSDSVRIGGR